MTNLTINENDVKEYFRFLDHRLDKIQTVCFLDISSKEVIKGFGIKYGTVRDVLEMCRTMEMPYTLHTCLNLGNLKGRQTQHMESTRVLCVDLDRIIENIQIKQWVEELQIGMVVESSPGKFHLYWHLESSLTQWKIYQLALAFNFKADLNLDQVSKTIRVPGIERVCKDGTSFMPSIKYLNHESLILTDSNIIKVFPHIEHQYRTALEFKKKVASETRAALKKARGEAKRGSSVVEKVEAPIIGRNNALYSEVREEVITEGLSVEEAQQVGADINGHFKEPLDEREVIKTVDSAYKAGVERLEEIERVKEEQKGKLKAINFNYNYELGVLKHDRFTDCGGMERMMQKHFHRLFRTQDSLSVFDETNKTWTTQKKSEELLQSLVGDVIEDMLNDEKFIDECCLDSKGKFSESAWKRERAKWRSGSKHKTLIEMLKREPRIIGKKISECDANLNLLHCKNGALNLLTGEIREARAQDYFLRQTGVVYDKNARCPWWENFISEIYAENETPSEIISFIQQVFGYTLTGNIGEQCIFIHCGSGANGKSRILYALKILLGEYTGIIEPKSMSQNPKAIRTEFNRLGFKFEGNRCVLIDDLNTETQWDESLVKNLTSHSLLARQLYAEERTIPNRAKIHIGCNSIPETMAGGYSVFRRLCIINYPRVFPINNVKYMEIERNIEKEVSGILNWALQGLWRTQREYGGTIKRPTEVYAAMEEYESGSFNVTSVFPKLFVKPEAHEEEEHWISVNELTDIINNYLTSIGKREKHISVDSAGRLLIKYYSKKRIWTEGRTNKAVVYSVKLLGSQL